MADDDGFVASGGVYQADHISGGFVHAVGCDARWLVTEVVTALVGYPDAIACVYERVNLVAPAVPEFGEAVQEDDERAIFCPRLDDVERDAIGGDMGVFYQ